MTILESKQLMIYGKFITHPELGTDTDFLFMYKDNVYNKKYNHINNFTLFDLDDNSWKRRSVFDDGWNEVELTGWDLVLHNMHLHFHFENPISMSIGYSGRMIEDYLKENVKLG